MNLSNAKGILKSSSIIGGAQLFQIIFGVLRTKLIAVILGPTGVGLSGLFQSTIQLATSIFGVGISQSSVKSFAEIKPKNIRELKSIISISITLVCLLGALAIIIMIMFSERISIYTFGTTKYSSSISVLSVSVLLNLLYLIFIAVAQGLRKLKLIALINIFTSIMGLLIAVPVYYLYGKNGIVWVLLLLSFSNFSISLILSKSYNYFTKFSFLQFISGTKSILKLGLAFAGSGFLLMLSSYLIRIFISSHSSITVVGHLNAATAITTLYLSLIFTAMSTDFYPKLVSFNKNNVKMNSLVNDQIFIGLLISGPIIILFSSFSYPILSILYTSEFTAASEVLQLQLIGTLFKAFSWPIGFIVLAKGHSKIFFITELLWNSIYYLITINFYDSFGLVAVGFGYLFGYICYSIIMVIIVKNISNYNLNKDSASTMTIFAFLVLCTYCTGKYFYGTNILYTIKALLIFCGFSYSYFFLRKIYTKKNIINAIKSKLFD